MSPVGLRFAFAARGLRSRYGPGSRCVWIAAVLALVPCSALAQGRPELRIERADGSVTGAGIDLDRGFAGVSLDLLQELGWTASADGVDVSVRVPGQIEIDLQLGTPFFRWDGVVLQLADAPYRRGAGVFVPLQLITDFFPRRLPDLYEFDGPNSTLRAGDPRPGRPDTAARTAEPRPSNVAPAPDPGPPDRSAPSAYEGVRVVVIDAGHGGADPGAMGPAGIREKSVALGIARGVAEILEGTPGLEIHMTRDGDTFVDLWERGEIATEIKGDRPAIFVSIHANSFPRRRAASGFETYFLSEARTEHERRVAAIENAPLSVQGQDVDPDEQPDLGFILRELRNLDHQHWSALLAELVQEELDGVHPGPNRGVKQGPMAVLTNALMPSVLVEVGYLSNEAEGRLLGERAFQADAAGAIAEAVVRFFERYPPGTGFGAREVP